MSRLLLPAVLALSSALAPAALADGVRGHALGADMARLLAAPAETEPPAPEGVDPEADALASCAAPEACPAVADD